MAIRLQDPEENAILNSVHYVRIEADGTATGPEYRLATVAGILQRALMDELYDKFCKERVTEHTVTQSDGSQLRHYIKR